MVQKKDFIIDQQRKRTKWWEEVWEVLKETYQGINDNECGFHQNFNTRQKERGKRGRINLTSHALDTFIGLVENKYLCVNVILSYDFCINIYLLQSSKKYILKSTSY